jgi:hypothetical protein
MKFTHYFTFTTNFGILPLNLDLASAPILSTAGGTPPTPAPRFEPSGIQPEVKKEK